MPFFVEFALAIDCAKVNKQPAYLFANQLPGLPG